MPAAIGTAVVGAGAATETLFRAKKSSVIFNQASKAEEVVDRKKALGQELASPEHRE